MEIKQIKISNLRPAEYNPRKMPSEEMRKLRQSIREFGFVENVVINEHQCEACGDRMYIVIGGHQRIEAALAEGFAEVPVHAVNVHIAKEKALNLALNRIQGIWDDKKLELLISDLKGISEIAFTGFSENEISKLLDRAMGIHESEFNEKSLDLPTEPTSKFGEIYELGKNRLLCGDATDSASYQKLLGGEKANMIFSDPPYNVDYNSRGENLKVRNLAAMQNDNLSEDEFANLIGRSFALMFANAKEGASFYICSGWSSYPQFLATMLENGFEHSGVIIWVKNTPRMGWNDYRYQHEWIAKAKKPNKKKAEAIIYGWKHGMHQFFGDAEFDVWEMPKKAVMHYLHPTEKPDWLAMRALQNSTKRGDLVLDPFAGSGSTLAAAEKTERRACLIELDPRFCDVIRKRWELMSQSKDNARL